ncbi:hypothetical protein [Bacillus sp. PS06]|uniref:hypothetical protein n=1 Tax=Bacillus sp. PS06 TaxID=2764176 RepID=UPI00177DD057|nr:hypothetical protein [Bacillus sp. PS06]MBD8068604.1 hypothetical protein [Bacillus sp. PS06]
MYLTEPSISNIVKQQYLFKLKSYLGFYFGLIVVQTLAILSSLNGTNGMYSSSNDFDVEMNGYSNMSIIAFTIIWGFIISIMITTKYSRRQDVSFISNHLTTNLANAAFILTMSIVSSLTAILSGNLSRVILYFSNKDSIFLGEHFHSSPTELLLSFYVTILYVLLVSIIGYLFGMLVQLFKPLVVIIPAAIIAVASIEQTDVTNLSMIQFFVQESSLLFFSLKVLITVCLIMGSIILFSSRLEVRG